MRSTLPAIVALVLGGLVSGCANDEANPLGPAVPTGSPPVDASWGPETPDFNLEIVLRGQGFGLVKFRQPNDAQKIIYLDTWVRDLAPDSEYLLQRAVDVTIDDNCTGTEWLTLGRGAQAQSIATDAGGTGRAELFRDLSAVPLGAEFDIHFRVIDAVTQTVVLESGCYQFRVSL
jgi:hypothetical protein